MDATWKFKVACLLMLLAWGACSSGDQERRANEGAEDYIRFQEDLEFMQRHTELAVLENGEGAMIAVSPALQGRVMTSSAEGPRGRSYGWINRELFESGDTLPHINVYGGEERFWLGPEGGQYSIFFEEGAAFNLDTWQTPRLIDLEPFAMSARQADQVTFTKTASLRNYSGFTFDIAIERQIQLLTSEQAFERLGIQSAAGLQMVAYQTANKLTNAGDQKWERDSGLLSIWLLGMFNPSPSTTVVIPYVKGDSAELGAVVNDTYFGKVPADRLLVKGDVIYFKGDGLYRSKIGLSPARSKGIMGAYDAVSQVLTLVTFDQPEGNDSYVNSLWEIQEEPYAGDAINSYNDGPPAPGEKPLGPFYELESSSTALELEPGESGLHIQETYHMEGEWQALDAVAQSVLGVSLAEIEQAFSR